MGGISGAKEHATVDALFSGSFVNPPETDIGAAKSIMAIKGRLKTRNMALSVLKAEYQDNGQPVRVRE